MASDGERTMNTIDTDSDVGTNVSTMQRLYPDSPWQFSNAQKVEMRSRRTSSGLIGDIDAYMISRMGEYVDIEELVLYLDARWENITEKAVWNNIAVRTSNQNAGKLYIPGYQIIRPYKPKGLEQSVRAPLVLVPSHYREQVLADESWIASHMRRDVRGKVMATTQKRPTATTRHKGFLDGIFNNLDLPQMLRNASVPILPLSDELADPASAVKDGENSDLDTGMYISPEQIAELEDLTRALEGYIAETKTYLTAALEEVLSLGDHASIDLVEMRGAIEKFEKTFENAQKKYSESMDFSRLDAALDELALATPETQEASESPLSPKAPKSTHAFGTDFQTAARAALPARDYQSNPISRTASRQSRISQRGEEGSLYDDSAAEVVLERQASSTSLSATPSVAESPALQLSPLKTPQDHFDEWASKFRGKDFRAGLIADIAEEDALVHLRDPNNYARDVFEALGNRLDNAMTITEISRSLPGVPMQIVREVLAEYSQNIAKLNIDATEPFSLEEVEVGRSYRLKSSPRNFRKSDFLSDMAVSRPVRG